MQSLDLKFVYTNLTVKEKKDVIQMWTASGAVHAAEAIKRVEQVSVLILFDGYNPSHK